jgi:hypothetical protein
VLANILKQVLKKIISNSHNAFINKRQILDSVFIANECIDSQLRSRVPSLICRLDLKKGYDRMKWEFLLFLLERSGFGEK